MHRAMHFPDEVRFRGFEFLLLLIGLAGCPAEQGGPNPSGSAACRTAWRIGFAEPS